MSRPIFLQLNTKEDILKNIGKQTVELDSIFNFITVNCLVADILQNIFVCVLQKKETHDTGLEHREGENDATIFWVIVIIHDIL